MHMPPAINAASINRRSFLSIEGTPDHHDSVLSEEEQARNDAMMLCVSRSLSERLVLDL